MWKRLKAGKRSKSDIPIVQASSDHLSVPNTTESPGRPRNHSLPESTLSLLPEAPFTDRRKSSVSVIHEEAVSSRETTQSHQRQRSQDRRDDPLGLTELHVPSERTVDIIFIHGLGGTSLRTWCHNRDLDYLWPQLWLPQDLPTARILTFGYNAHFSSSKDQPPLTIRHFASDLLWQMKHEKHGEHRLGQVPIIVVAHSMGGLVFKRAFMQGQSDDKVKDIVSRVKAVLFLATPHRGTDLAATLNKVLKSSVFGHSAKDYIYELVRGSPALADLNDSFRHHDDKVEIYSFFETLRTSVGPMSVMILEQDSSVMGYRNEIARPLIANHHTVSKFTGTDDPNYKDVVSALRNIVDSIHSSQSADFGSLDELQHIETLLGIPGPPEEELAAGRTMRKAGTCESFLMSEEMKGWLDFESRHVLWAHAPPGSGKSTLCSFVVDHLLDNGFHCAYFFFKHGKRHKQSLGTMVRSMAYQTALRMPLFRRALADLARSGVQIQALDAVAVWKLLFLDIFSKLDSHGEVFWVIDGMDESESSKLLVQFISTFAAVGRPVRILVFSRPLSTIRQAFEVAQRPKRGENAESRISVVEMALPDNQQDIRSVVAGEIDYLPSSDEFKRQTVEEITARSQGNFLWASLVLKRVVKCHRQEQVQRVLESTPDGMEELYDRMLDVIIDLDMDEDKALARILLSCCIYSKSSLTLEQLSEVYAAELGSIMDLEHTVNEVCGQFVVINAENEVSLVHHSAREYLRKAGHKSTSLSLDPAKAHEELFGKCLVTLCDRNLRTKINTPKEPQFLRYAAVSWAFHLDSSSPHSDRILNALVRFFSGPFTLIWIQYLATNNQLSELFTVSRKLSSFAKRRRKAASDRSPLLHRLSDLSLLETWAVDLMKIPAKFGRHLSEDPSLIYKCIPPLCPTSSVISQKFANNSTATISITGLSNAEWDDCLARVSAGEGRASKLAASSLHLAVATEVPKGSITLWHTNLFQEYTTFNVGEYIRAMAFNNSGSLFACYGVTQTCMWNVHDATLVLQTKNPRDERAIAFQFDENDTLMMVSDYRRIFSLPTKQPEPFWRHQDQISLGEKGVWLGTPSSVAFNSSCTQIAVAYRSSPLSIWNLDPPEMVAKLRKKARQGQGSVNSNTGDNKVVWHPSGAHVIGIYGQIFKWSPLDDAYDEVKGDIGTVPHEIQCSPNGIVFVTIEGRGAIKIYDFSSMSLLYRLTSEDAISHICFSPENTRFYDLRGSYCNIWEPNCLVRLVDAAAERISDTDSMSESFWSDADETGSTLLSFAASESRADTKPAIKTMATGHKAGELLAYAKENSIIELIDPAASPERFEPAQVLTGKGIEHLAWDEAHDRMAYSRRNGSISVNSVHSRRASEPGSPAQGTYDEKTSLGRGRTRQLLFNDKGDLLLVYGATKSQVRRIPGGELVTERATPAEESAKWKRHPSNPEHLLCFTNDEVASFTWQQLEKKASYPFDKSGFENPIAIDAILDSYCSHYVLLRTSTLHLGRTKYGFLLLDMEGVFSDRPGEPESQKAVVKPVELPTVVSKAVEHPIGILPDGQLVFMDTNLWVCSAQLRGNVGKSGTFVRHFFLPRDWVTSSGIRLCQVLDDGTFLCPSKGEVAIIKSNLVSDW